MGSWSYPAAPPREKRRKVKRVKVNPCHGKQTAKASRSDDDDQDEYDDQDEDDDQAEESVLEHARQRVASASKGQARMDSITPEHRSNARAITNKDLTTEARTAAQAVVALQNRRVDAMMAELQRENDELKEQLKQSTSPHAAVVDIVRLYQKLIEIQSLTFPQSEIR